MISRMKKLTFLVYHKEYEQFLQAIRDIGVVHVAEKQAGIPENEELQDNMKLSARYAAAIKLLQELSPEIKEAKGNVESGYEILEQVDVLLAEKVGLNSQMQACLKDKIALEPWGNFELSSLDKLKEVGYYVNFYVCSERNFNTEWIEEYHVMEISRMASRIYFITITKEELPDLDAELVKIPQDSLATIEKRIHTISQKTEELVARLQLLAEEHLNSLIMAEQEVHANIEFSKVILNTEDAAGSKLMMLQGWVPEEKETELIQYLENNHVFYELELPVPQDDVPILLKNNFFTKLFEPITEMFALPNYTELDPTPFFAPFFMLFFGLCMGDGGYGLLIFLACVFLKKKVAPSMRSFCTLGEFLGIATIVVGLLTGSFFGIALDTVEWPWLAGVKQYFLTENNYAQYLGGYSPMMILAVIIGIIQILFGMCVSAAKVTKQFGFKYAQSIIAWVVLIIVSIITFGIPQLGVLLPEVLNYVAYAVLTICAGVIFFYNSPGKNIIVNIGSGLWGTYNMATGLLGDTLSYIRLFALGLTGSILGGVFNTLAFDLTASLPIVAQYIAALLILLAGHAINFGLCMIGAFVHPMRLTFVEFYKNAGFEGGGKAYKPFRK